MREIKLALIKIEANPENCAWESKFSNAEILVEKKIDGVTVPELVELDRTPFPEYAKAQFYTKAQAESGIVVDFGGRRWRVTFTSGYEITPVYRDYIPSGGVLVMKPADGEELTPFAAEMEDPDEYAVQLFGQPVFNQAEVFLPIEGKEYVSPVFLVHHDYGVYDQQPENADISVMRTMMNWNLFLETDGDGIPTRCLYEASCS